MEGFAPENRSAVTVAKFLQTSLSFTADVFLEKTTAYCVSPCVHGTCIGPDLCLCDSGWRGIHCSTGNQPPHVHSNTHPHTCTHTHAHPHRTMSLTVFEISFAVSSFFNTFFMTGSKTSPKLLDIRLWVS